MSRSPKLLPLVAVLALAGCVSVPTGPSVMALPGTGRDFDSFRADDGGCRQFAYDQIGGQTATNSQQNAAVGSAVIGTAIGALAGAAIGGNANGAAVGAGVGLLGGSLAGASAGNVSAYEAQRRYDMAYTQCMYARGHRVPTAGRFTTSAPPAYSRPSSYTAPPPPPPGTPPPPPVGAAPPPPPGY